MRSFIQNHNFLKKSGLAALTVLIVVTGSLLQQRVLEVSATVQVLLVSRNAIAFGDVFPGQSTSETYNVQLDTSAQSATYVTTLDQVPGLQNLCPYLSLKNIDSPGEPDTLANSTLTRPGDTLDKWQVSLTVPGIKGELSQDNSGGIIVQGGDFGCKITVTTNSEPTRIIICKRSVGGADTFNFIGGLDSFNIKTFPGGDSAGYNGDDNKGQDCVSQSNQNDPFGERIFTDLTPGNFHITEPNPGSVWGFTSLVCSDPTHNTLISGSSAYITLDPNETVVCTYVNTKKTGSIEIIKNTVGGDGEFYFNGSLGPFLIQTTHGSGNQTFNGLTPGVYTVAEPADQSGWGLTGISCVDPSGDTITHQRNAVINLSAGETVVCTYVNTKKTGSIEIIKNTVGGDGEFYFNGSLGPFLIQTTHGSGNQTFNGLTPGVYTVAEPADQSGWGLTGISCVDPSGDTITHQRNAVINLSAGETVVCTYVNTKK